MTDLHALAHATWDAQWVRDTPPTREEALAAVADAVAAAVAEEISLARESELAPARRIASAMAEEIAAAIGEREQYTVRAQRHAPGSVYLEGQREAYVAAAAIARRIGGSHG